MAQQGAKEKAKRTLRQFVRDEKRKDKAEADKRIRDDPTGQHDGAGPGRADANRAQAPPRQRPRVDAGTMPLQRS